MTSNSDHDLPVEAYPVLDKRLAKLLDVIRSTPKENGEEDDEADKKCYTAILYGIARATPGIREDSIFDRSREDAKQICSRSVWYGGWKQKPEIKAVWEYVVKLTRTYRDAETMRIEMGAQQLLKRSLAEGQVDAIEGLRKTALSMLDRADFRTEASKTLLTLGSEELAARLAAPHPGALPVEITGQPEQVVKLDVSALPAEILRALADSSPDSGATAGSPEDVSDRQPD